MARMVSVNNDALRFAREYYALTIEEVSVKTKIKSSVLEQYENGNDFPTYAQLEKLSDFYNKPMFYFFEKSVAKYEVDRVAFRRIGNEEPSKRIKELMESANIYKLNLSELYKDEKGKTFFDLMKQHECKDGEKLICVLRQLLDLSLDKQVSYNHADQLLEYLRDKLYDIGIYVFKDSFKDNTVSGLCIYDEEYPIILLNNKTTFTRQLFTLFHEIYHIFCREADVDYISQNEENACNNFASFFLIPKEDFRHQLSLYDDFENEEVIRTLAKRYCVSNDAVMYRLLKEDKIDASYYRDQKILYFRESKSSGGNFYFTRMSYLGNAYLNKVFSAYYSGQITKAQVGMYTKLKPIHISKLASMRFGGAY